VFQKAKPKWEQLYGGISYRYTFDPGINSNLHKSHVASLRCGFVVCWRIYHLLGTLPRL